MRHLLRVVVAVLLMALTGCSQQAQREAAQTSQDEATRRQLAEAGDATANMALLAWNAFQCFTFGEMAGEPKGELERLFELGYESGKRFIDAAIRGGITEDEFRRKVPIGLWPIGLQGPTVDFKLGQIYEKSSQDAYDRVVKRDSLGIDLPPEKWEWDKDTHRLRARAEYTIRNCAFLK